MWALVIMAVLVTVGVVALAAQPVSTPAVAQMAATALSLEPAWMVLSGAVLLAIASMVRRLAR